jgi:hypothetical protein
MKRQKASNYLPTALAKMYNKIAQIELTLLAMFVFVSVRRKTFAQVVARCVSETFLPKWRLRELPTAAGLSVI